MNFLRAQESILQGELVAEGPIPEIKKTIGSLNLFIPSAIASLRVDN